MRQINFVIIFVICLALVLFSLQNTDPVSIHVVKGIDVQAPLSVELIIAMGVGAVFAWVFSVWTQLQRLLDSRKSLSELQQREAQIQELQQDVERYRAEVEEQRHLLPAGKTVIEES